MNRDPEEGLAIKAIDLFRTGGWTIAELKTVFKDPKKRELFKGLHNLDNRSMALIYRNL